MLGDEAARQLLTTCLSKSWSNPRKRPSASKSSDAFDTVQQDLALSEFDDDTVQPHKKSRAADWPLKGTDASIARSVTPRRAHRIPLSPSQRHNRSIKPRPSKFFEGSMNDRVSAKPPSIYTQDEAAMEHYHGEPSSTHDSNGTEDDKIYFDAGIETAKPSGVYRFGRALVSAFNPLNVWQGINGIWKEKEQYTNLDKSVLQQRKIKAEKAYAELKQNGFKGTQPCSAHAASIDQARVVGKNTESDLSEASLRTSDASISQPRSSAVFKHDRPTPVGSGDLLIAQTSMDVPRASTLANQAEEGHRTSLNLRRPSFQSLKKVKSHIQLPSAKRRAADASLLFPSLDANPQPNGAQALRRQPSKKDVAKRQKLSKQVSNLEGKLQAARRELQLCSSQVPDVPEIPKAAREWGVPRALPSFPAAPDTKIKSRNPREESDPDWQPTFPRAIHDPNLTPRKPALKATTGSSSKSAAEAPPNGQLSTSKKRKSSNSRSSDDNCKPGGMTNIDYDIDIGVSAKKVPRTRKSQEWSDAAGIEVTLKRSPASGSKETTSKKQTGVPPVPPLAIPFDPAKVDKNKLLAICSIPKDDLPFGSHLDDIVNLQKDFPHCTQKQLDEYLSSLSKSHGATEERKNSENQPPNSLTFGDSRSASPVKPSAFQDVSGRNGQACKNSSPNRKIGRELSTIDEAITIDPAKDRSVPPMPANSIMKSQSANQEGKHTDQPLPKIQKEDYSWPEDVF
ncbi:MAG: hypothetical protein Q9170_001634 [Blastenia crenularia]